MSDDGLEEFEPDGLDILFDDDYPINQRMIIVKVLAGGDIHAEDNDGQMIVCRTDGTVDTLLHGDRGWVCGELPGVDQENLSVVAWDIIGFHLGLTEGLTMGRVRDGRAH